MGLIARFLFPDAYVRDVDEIPYERLYEKGYRVVLFDIDNTVVTHGAPADEHARALFRRIRDAHLTPVLVSNNKETRVKPFADDVGAHYLHKAGKPSVKGMRKAMALGGGTVTDTFLVGDQIFTDILGAKAAGIKAVLAKPLSRKEEFQIVLKRFPEKAVLALYRRRMRRGGRKMQEEDAFGN